MRSSNGFPVSSESNESALWTFKASRLVQLVPYHTHQKGLGSRYLNKSTQFVGHNLNSGSKSDQELLGVSQNKAK